MACLLLCGASAVACGGGLPKPPGGPTPKDAFFEVPYPPPPARVETVPEKKQPAAVWVDGQWDWDGKAYRWHAGTWMTPPQGGYFTRWTTRRQADGRLYFARAAWRGADGKSLDLWPSLGLCKPGEEPAAVAGSQ